MVVVWGGAVILAVVWGGAGEAVMGDYSEGW